MRALIGAVWSTPSIVIIEGMDVRRLGMVDNTVDGVWANCPGREGVLCIAASRIGQRWGRRPVLETTNPLGN
ncbi:hypothetical protein [Bradyrhizobium sp. USDA 3650]